MERIISAAGEARFTDICRELAENCPERTEAVYSGGSQESNDPWARRFGQALRGNTSVTSLSVFTSAMTLTAADGISRFIAYSPTIDELNLFTSSHPFNIGDQRRANVDHFLGAATFNGKIAKLDVHQECGVLALINCLRANRGSLRSLTLSFWEGENGLATQQMTEDAETIADAVASLPLLEELSLCDRDDRFFVAPIIDRFIGHPTLTKLCLEHDRTRDEDRDRHSDELRVAMRSSMFCDRQPP